MKSRNRMNQMPCTVIPTTHCLVALRKGPPHEQNCQERNGARARYRTRLVPGKVDMVETTSSPSSKFDIFIPKMTPCLKGNALLSFFKPFLVSRLDFGGISLGKKLLVSGVVDSFGGILKRFHPFLTRVLLG